MHIKKIKIENFRLLHDFTIDLEEDKKLKMLNFYLKLEGWSTFDKMFKKTKLDAKDIW